MQLAEIRYEVDFLQSLIDELSLCLDGLSIYTEAASNSYEMCPILALLAGAQEVVAQTRDSKYATAEEVEFRTNEIAKLLGLNSKLKVVKSRDYGSLRTTDIVTNSNFVRPIDRDLIAHLSPTAVIPLMWKLGKSEMKILTYRLVTTSKYWPWGRMNTGSPLICCHTMGFWL